MHDNLVAVCYLLYFGITALSDEIDFFGFSTIAWTQTVLPVLALCSAFVRNTAGSYSVAARQAR